MVAGVKGRPKGSPNKRSLDIGERLEALGVDPVAKLMEIAADPDATKGQKISIYTELLQYLYPKRKAVEMDASPTMQTWAELVRQSIKGDEKPKDAAPQ